MRPVYHTGKHFPVFNSKRRGICAKITASKLADLPHLPPPIHRLQSLLLATTHECCTPRTSRICSAAFPQTSGTSTGRPAAHTSCAKPARFEGFRALARLDLSSNHLSSHAVERLARKLCCATALHTLKIQWSVRTNSMHSLAEGLRKCSGLTSLTLSYNLVNDDRITRYALRLQHCRRRLLVDFTGNNIFNGGAEASLEHHEALREFLLPHNNIGLRGASALLEHSRRRSTLTSLELSNNLIGSCSTARVHPSLHSFLNLRLRSTHDAPSDFEAMLDRAVQATVLRRLNLTGNHLTVAEIQDIAKRWGPGRPGLCMVHPQDETVYAL